MGILQQVLSESGIGRVQRAFMSHLLGLWLVIPGGINYVNMQRYSPHSEQTFRNWFAKGCEHQTINTEIISKLQAAGRMGKTLVLGGDASFIRKAGKATAGIAKFWNGSVAKAQSGLELSAATVIDLEYRQAVVLKAVQTPANFAQEESRVSHYAGHIKTTLKAMPANLRKQIKAIVVDAYYTKQRFIDSVLLAQSELGCDMAIVGKLRKDANLHYLYPGKPTGKPGRPKELDGKVDFKDFSKWDEVEHTHSRIVLTSVVKSKSLKRHLRVVLIDWFNLKGRPIRRELLFCTSLSFAALLIIECYRARYEMEFCFRDAKGFAGLEDCQARNTPALEFHWNTAFLSVNLARAQQLLDFHGHINDFVFSLEDAKRLAYNQFLAQRIIRLLPPEINQHNIWLSLQNALNLGVKAA
jgi:putative transposase